MNSTAYVPAEQQIPPLTSAPLYPAPRLEAIFSPETFTSDAEVVAAEKALKTGDVDSFLSVLWRLVDNPHIDIADQLQHLFACACFWLSDADFKKVDCWPDAGIELAVPYSLGNPRLTVLELCPEEMRQTLKARHTSMAQLIQ